MPLLLVSSSLAVLATPVDTDSLVLEGRVGILWSVEYTAKPPGAYPRAVTVSSSGEMVFVAGAAPDVWWLREDYLALGFGAQSGELRWIARYDENGHGDRVVQAMAPSPDGDAVYLAGTSRTSPPEIQTVAFAAGDGLQLWSAQEGREAAAIAVDPRGNRIFVTGSAPGSEAGWRVVYVVARNARTGALLWRSVTQILENAGGLGIVPSPDGRSVYVLAAAADRSGTKAGHVARYDAATGAVVWAARLGEHGEDVRIGCMAMNREGTTLFVAGWFAGPGVGTGIVRALDAERGRVLWTRWHAGRAEPWAMAVSADGAALFLGYGEDAPEAGLEALNAATGDPLWNATRRGGNGVRRIAVSSRGDRVAVLAEQGLSLSVLDARSGATIWSARYPAEARPADLVFDSAGRTLFAPSRSGSDGVVRIRLTAFRESAVDEDLSLGRDTPASESVRR